VIPRKRLRHIGIIAHQRHDGLQPQEKKVAVDMKHCPFFFYPIVSASVMQ
jgi:hypothetical protein